MAAGALEVLGQEAFEPVGRAPDAGVVAPDVGAMPAICLVSFGLLGRLAGPNKPQAVAHLRAAKAGGIASWVDPAKAQ